ncbi:phage tail protein [Pseudomonas umsongensis]|uniref:phage tail-collar fiber domain-containing protein n=1 Tax=Pseudomonas umsongensis TaxID=198618 RepID=UPI00036EB957|nr:phage tail protein [Pseudomonas umsongensis]
MGASITLAGENLIAEKHAAQQGLDVARFIFANVPGLDPSGPVDRAAPKPAAGQIVYVYDIPEDNAGYVNPNQVVYSAQIGSDVGDWDFNWIGLESAEGVLFAVAYVPLQIKRRNIPPLQIGNNLTRNFLVVFDGALALTGISIDASTWQHDFTVRLAGIDERERLSNRDIYGRACFFGSSLQLEKVGGVYQLKPGTAYVEGIRLVRSAVLPVAPPAIPTAAWLDVCLQRELSDVVATWAVVFGAEKVDYTDSAGARHYCVAIADLPNAATVTDRRSVEPISGPLVTQFAARVGDYPDLRARATTKDDVDLGNLPNAKTDDPTVTDSEILATAKMVAGAIALVTAETGVEQGFYDRVLVNKRGLVTSATRQKVTTLSANAVLTADHRGIVNIDATAGTRTVTLPSSVAVGVIDILVRRVDNSGNLLVVNTQAGDKIRFHIHLNGVGYPHLLLMGCGDWWHLRSDGSGGWLPIARLDPTPLGAMPTMTSTSIPPGGYGIPNGTLQVRANLPWLFDHAAASGMMTTEANWPSYQSYFSAGDGSTTFRLLDVRGMFVRTADEGRGIDLGRATASLQGFNTNMPTGQLAGSLTATLNLANGSYVSGSIVAIAGPLVGNAGETRPSNLAYPRRLKVI